MTKTELSQLTEVFQFDGACVSIAPTGNGHINDTLLVITDKNQKYILQRINHQIFTNPEKLMENVALICDHLHEKIQVAGGDSTREALTIIPTIEGSLYHQAKDGSYWRGYLFIDDAISYDIVPSNDLFEAVAYKLGEFQKLLLDFDAAKFYEPIPFFHHTKNRFKTFTTTLEQNPAGRAEAVQAEIQFVLDHKKDTEALLDLYEAGTLPLRVTHNNTKINNVM